MKTTTTTLLSPFLLLFLLLSPVTSHQFPAEWYQGDINATMNNVMIIKQKEWAQCSSEGKCPMNSLTKLSDVKCENGKADVYDCMNIDLLSFIPLESLGCEGDGNDIWGWTDPITEKEIAIFCCESGTSFIDVTEPVDPVVLGFLPSYRGIRSSWRDAKVYLDHVFIVSEAYGHGMQVFDLTRLRGLDGETIVTLSPDTRYTGELKLGSVHNIVINEDSGYAYAVGSTTCRAGLHMINIQDPINPLFAGCYADDGYVHDAQCVIYDGPDCEFRDQEICFCYNEDSLTIVDVTDKAVPVELSNTPYRGSAYTHQGWLLADGKHLLANDELDEVENTAGYNGDPGRRTRTLKWNVEDLRNPKLIGSFLSSETSIDHNLYIIDDLAYLANYCAGLRILNVADIEDVSEVGFFDVSPDCDTVSFFGSWSSYPFFESDNIVVSSIERGLFVLKYNN